MRSLVAKTSVPSAIRTQPVIFHPASGRCWVSWSIRRLRQPDCIQSALRSSYEVVSICSVMCFLEGRASARSVEVMILQHGMVQGERSSSSHPRGELCMATASLLRSCNEFHHNGMHWMPALSVNKPMGIPGVSCAFHGYVYRNTDRAPEHTGGS